MSDREKILNRIRKCLKLSKSSEPHEAAAALRQAQKLMAAHSVDETELLGIEVSNKLAITRCNPQQTIPLHLAHLAALISRAFAVEAVWEPVWTGRSHKMAMRYFGANGRADLAAYSHEVIERTLWSAWDEYRRQLPWLNRSHKGIRMGFWLGWLARVRSTVMEFGGEEERELAKKAAAAFYGNSINEAKRNKQKVSHAAMQAGAAAAEGFQLHRPMEGAKSAQLYLTND